MEEKMSKSEKNFIRSIMNNKRWKAGSLNRKQRKELIEGLVDKGFIDENLNLLERGHRALLN